MLMTGSGLSVPVNYGITFQAGTFALTTSSKALNYQSIDLFLTCSSPLSLTGPGGSPFVATNSFTVSFRDECYDTKITAPMQSSYEIPLF